MKRARLTVSVPDDVAETDAISVLEQMVEEYFYANREHLGDALELVLFNIEKVEEGQ